MDRPAYAAPVFGNWTLAVVLNESRNVPITASAITDNFGLYAVHIYVIAVDEIFSDGFE
jgi:hypothetical protein